jgi:hypothetical protein
LRGSSKRTFFATHNSVLVKSLDPEMFEIGIHPRFENLNEITKSIQDLKKIYLEARSYRS